MDVNPAWVGHDLRDQFTQLAVTGGVCVQDGEAAVSPSGADSPRLAKLGSEIDDEVDPRRQLAM
jgi:hypothetical protein